MDDGSERGVRPLGGRVVVVDLKVVRRHGCLRRRDIARPRSLDSRDGVRRDEKEPERNDRDLFADVHHRRSLAWPANRAATSG
jgi:hypothetical protein